MSWLTRNWKPTVAATVLATAAVGITYKGSNPQPERPLLGRLEMRSPAHLTRQAQGWLTAPAAATKTHRWKTQETSGNLSDDLSGDAAVLTAAGTPAYALFTPIPTTAGWTRKAIWFNGTDSRFIAGNNTVADQTTNNFSASFWIRILEAPAGDQWIIDKRTGNTGWSIRVLAGTTTLGVQVGDGVLASGTVTGVLTPGWHLVTVVFTRASNATAYIDGVDGGVTFDISARSGSLTSAIPLNIGSDTGGANWFAGGLSEVLIANGVTTLAENRAWYKAFKVPTSPAVTYTQASTVKAPVSASGLGVYAPGQWHAIYDSGASTLGNPLQTGFRTSPQVINILGRVNEFDQWSTDASGVTVVVNSVEAPDGAMNADAVTFDGDGAYIYKAAVGGGVIAPGERWCGSLFLKKSSVGGCPSVTAACAGGIGWPTTFNLTTSWAHYSACCTNAGQAKQLGIYGTDCTVHAADAQYQQNNVTDPCTTTVGDASQTCDKIYAQVTTEINNTLMPSTITRGEISATVVDRPWVGSPTSRVALMLGRFAKLAYGDIPVGMLFNQGGGLEFSSIAKPVAVTGEHTYALAWDYQAGVTNSQAYAAFFKDSQRMPTALHARMAAPTTGLTPDLPTTKDYNQHVLTLGCDADGNNCSYSSLIDVQVWGRPESSARTATTDNVISVGNTEADYLSAAPALATGLLWKPAGSATASTWIWHPGVSHSAKVTDVLHNAALQSGGTTTNPPYKNQRWSGFIARGQGRRGVQFIGASNEYVEAAANSTASIGTATSAVIQALVSHDPTSAATQGIVGNTMDASVAGYGLWTTNNPRYYCAISDGTNARICYHGPASVNSLTGYKLRHIVCRLNKTAGTWDDPKLYYGDVTLSTTCSGTNPTGTLANTGLVRLGSIGANYLTGQVHEVQVLAGGAYSDTTVKTDYLRSFQTGQYWRETSDSVAHYKMNEGAITAGVGVRDHSVTAGHLSTVSGTPDPQYADMPWPQGNWMPAISSLGSSAGTVTSYTEASDIGTCKPVDGQSFSAAVWARITPDSTCADDAAGGGVYLMYKDQVAADDWGIISDRGASCGKPTFWWGVNTVYCVTRINTNIRDGRWHLVAVKATKSGNDWTPYISLDGAAFVAGTTISGDAGQNTSILGIPVVYKATVMVEVAGAMCATNYALTDADVLAYWNAVFGTKTSSAVTYARTNTACYTQGVHPVDGIQVGCYPASAYPMAYSSVAGVPGNERWTVGEPVNAAVTNLALQSHDATTTWVKTNVTATANTASAPDGTTTADTVTASAGNGDLRQAFGTIAAATHTYCQYLRRNGAADVAGFVRLVKNSDNSEIATTAFTATNAWQRFCVSGAAVLNDTRIETKITTNGQSVYWWGASLTATASWPGVYCPTTTASATCNATSSNYVAAANLTGWTRSQGTISSVTVPTNATGYAFDLHDGSDLNGAIRLVAPTNQALLYSSTGVLQQDVRLTNAQTSLATGVILAYDSQSAFYSTTRRAYAVSQQSSYAGEFDTYSTDTTANWTPAAGTNLYLGMDNAASNTINGLHVRTSIWKTR